MTSRLVLASHNRKKARELRSILEPLGMELLSLADFPGAPEPEETGDAFAENAVIKAASAAAFTGLPALADDSGLEVDALDGRPGVRSARFAGENAGDQENNALLLKELEGIPKLRRSARFVSVIAFVRPGGAAVTFRGTTEGRILDAPRGTGGFGYDPLFWSNALRRSFGEAEAEAKNRVSHRGRALMQFVEYINRNLTPGSTSPQ